MEATVEIPELKETRSSGKFQDHLGLQQPLNQIRADSLQHNALATYHGNSEIKDVSASEGTRDVSFWLEEFQYYQRGR